MQKFILSKRAVERTPPRRQEPNQLPDGSWGSLFSTRGTCRSSSYESAFVVNRTAPRPHEPSGIHPRTLERDPWQFGAWRTPRGGADLLDSLSWHRTMMTSPRCRFELAATDAPSLGIFPLPPHFSDEEMNLKGPIPGQESIHCSRTSRHQTSLITEPK